MKFQAAQALRRALHCYPEISDSEVETATRIAAFLEPFHPNRVIRGLGGHGVAAVYEFARKGPTVVIRCELDALPIAEENDFAHRSRHPGVAHKCGHDGHMAIVAGLAPWLATRPVPSGKVVLLFQPAEETGRGALAVREDENFRDLAPDYLFALHNIPGEPLHQVIVTDESFSAEVISFRLSLTGVESHAAEPERGKNPALALSETVAALATLNVTDPLVRNFAVLTPVHLLLGQKAYGISPGQGELHYTVRTWTTDGMATLRAEIERIVAEVSDNHGLQWQVEWFEHFPASRNDPAALQFVKKAAITNGFTLQERPYPFKFGEDFGWFAQRYKTALFGLGAGLDTPSLHNPGYDFPDELIETGVKMFTALVRSILSTSP